MTDGTMWLDPLRDVDNFNGADATGGDSTDAGSGSGLEMVSGLFSPRSVFLVNINPRPLNAALKYTAIRPLRKASPWVTTRSGEVAMQMTIQEFELDAVNAASRKFHRTASRNRPKNTECPLKCH